MTAVHAICWVLLYVMVLPFMLACGLTYIAQVTEAGARRAATKQSKGFYLCTFCHRWHVGGTPKKVAS